MTTAKRFIDQQLPGFNFKSYLLTKYDGFFPSWMPTAKEMDIERRNIMMSLDKYQRKDALEKWKKKRSRYNKVMQEWAKLQR